MQKKRVLITGASRGIGKAAAEIFAENGCDLILVCRKNTELLQCLSQKLEQSYAIKTHGFTGDISHYSEVERLYRELSQKGWQYPDVLINNAGISYIGLFTEMTPEEWNRIIATNLGSVFNTCRLFAPGMISRQRGRIINISSVWGNVGASCEAAYSASKGGVNAFTRALAKELAPSHISVNAIAFGAIDTEMNQFLTETEREALMEEIPACRMGTAREAAEMIVSVASFPEYFTGQIITMDGGWI